MLTVQLIAASDTYHLRHTVLRPNQPIEDCKYENDLKPTSFHLGAYVNDQLIAHLLFIY